MRVYELAKQLGMENRELIPELKRMGITVASHSSALDDDVVQKALEKLSPKAKVSAKAPGKEADAGRGERSKAAAPVAEESSKSDKRRILIKRKRDDETPVEVVASLPVVEAIGSSGATVDTHVVSPTLAHPLTEALAAPHPELTPMPAMTSPVGATIAPPPITAAKPAVAPSIYLTAGKKKALSLEEIQADGLKEKSKKARKPGRTREEE